ncbi:L,D-transpeptidase family protein [[Ruminococcus] lactaris]|nr:L,D-transpeptidase family protein [[Ruminococcus] lactaris]
MGVPYIGVQQIKKKIYVFDSSGVLGKGWTVYGSRKYYANAKGEITRGFKTIDGKTYFFNDYGSMHTGWLYYNGKYYYLNPSDGVMVTGTKNIGGTSYTFSDSGISSRALEGNWTVKVNRQQNVVTVYKGNTPVRAMICSTGLNNGTPLGTFTIQDKLYTHALYGPSFGYYCSHITSEILFHSIPQPQLGRKNLPAYKYNLLGTQASEGCIRLSMGDAYWLFNTVPIGTTVVVYDSPNPGPLGKPKGIKIPLSQSYDPTDPLYFNTGK